LALTASYPLNLRLPIRLAEQLDELAKRDQSTLSAVARDLLSRGVDRELQSVGK
jgi:predicted transcriptional regulator